MAWTELTEVDRLVLDRWSEVRGLLDAYRQVQDRIEERIETIEERLQRWAKEQGYEIAVDAKQAVISAYLPSWFDKRRGARVCLVLGDFCPLGYRKVGAQYPYLAVYAGNLENFKIRREGRLDFAEALRQQLGEQAKEWHDPAVDDAENPLWRDLREYDERVRCALAADPAKLYEFAVKHLPELFQLSGFISAALERLPK